ncbi:MAG: very short patch repair endonuclease [bacterium]|nr:very short patch repair endonuclease [bacterium]
MDNLTKEQRRKNMQHIRSTGTAPERAVMEALKKKKIYFATYISKIIGKPDIVFRRKKVAVFIDSDFWHGHPKRCIMPKTNSIYWKKKIEGNQKRDKLVNVELKNNGWVVVRLWEYDIKHSFEKSFQKILKAIGKKQL